jgi:hypothetical protein
VIPLNARTGTSSTLAVTRDGAHAYLACITGIVEIDLRAGKATDIFMPRPQFVAIDPADRLLAIGTVAGVAIRDRVSKALVAIVPVRLTTSPQFSADARYLVGLDNPMTAQGPGGTLFIWDLGALQAGLAPPAAPPSR